MRRNILTLLLLILASVGVATAQRVKPSGESLRVNLIGGDKSTVTVRSVGNGTNEATCAQDAQIKAMKTILFVGVSSPATDKKYTALVSGRDEGDDYFSSFFGDQKHKNYISVCAPSSSLDKVKGQKQKEQAFDITVNISALETALRNDKIIKRMGLQ